VKYFCMQLRVPEVQGEGKFGVCSEVCLRSWLRYMLPCNLMCVYGTGRGKYYCVL